MRMANDAEYQRIIQELKALGINPSGNKETDKAKLTQAKLELVQKIEAKQEEDDKQKLQVQPIAPVDESQNAARSQLEEQRLGAMTVAELNRLYFGI